MSTLGVEGPFGDIGPAIVVWDPDGDNITLGPTNGAITPKIEQFKKEVFEDGHGDAPVDLVLMGKGLTVEADLTRLTVDQLTYVVQGSSKVGTSLKIVNKAGGSLYDTAKLIIIKPLVDDVAVVDSSKWFYIYKGVILENLEMPFDRETQRNFHAIIQGFPDNTSGRVGVLGSFGPLS